MHLHCIAHIYYTIFMDTERRRRLIKTSASSSSLLSRSCRSYHLISLRTIIKSTTKKAQRNTPKKTHKQTRKQPPQHRHMRLVHIFHATQHSSLSLADQPTTPHTRENFDAQMRASEQASARWLHYVKLLPRGVNRTPYEQTPRGVTPEAKVWTERLSHNTSNKKNYISRPTADTHTKKNWEQRGEHGWRWWQGNGTLPPAGLVRIVEYILT